MAGDQGKGKTSAIDFLPDLTRFLPTVLDVFERNPDFCVNLARFGFFRQGFLWQSRGKIAMTPAGKVANKFRQQERDGRQDVFVFRVPQVIMERGENLL